MSRILNQEHLEAEQIATNKKREDFIASLPQEEQNKFKIIERITKEMTDAKISFYLFPYLPDSDYPKKKCVWQWNSILALTEYDEFGKSTKEYQLLNSQFHNSLFYTIYHQFCRMVEGKNFYDSITNFGHLISWAIGQHISYINEDKKPGEDLPPTE